MAWTFTSPCLIVIGNSVLTAIVMPRNTEARIVCHDLYFNTARRTPQVLLIKKF
jgi:hypothetical protein